MTSNRDIDIPKRMEGESSDDYILRLQEHIATIGHEILYWRQFYLEIESICERLDSVVVDVIRRQE